eukprot:scaffold43572_cov61-Phaeocystis_antarctica.AAC.1
MRTSAHRTRMGYVKLACRPPPLQHGAPRVAGSCTSSIPYKQVYLNSRIRHLAAPTPEPVWAPAVSRVAWAVSRVSHLPTPCVMRQRQRAKPKSRSHHHIRLQGGLYMQLHGVAGSTFASANADSSATTCATASATASDTVTTCACACACACTAAAAAAADFAAAASAAAAAATAASTSRSQLTDCMSRETNPATSAAAAASTAAALCFPRLSSRRHSSLRRSPARFLSCVATSVSLRMVHTAVPSSSAMRRRPA